MNRRSLLFLGVAAMGYIAALAQANPPGSPWEMAVATERWLVDGAGARFLPGMENPARDGDAFVFVDEAWPLPFRDRVGDPVFLRVSPITGCYEFEDADGTVFWTVVPNAPLTWNWISPFRSPLRPDEQNLYSPFRIVREWRLTTPEIEAMRADPMRRAARRSAPAAPVTNLCFTALAVTNDVLFFTADWPASEALPESALDLYGSSNLPSRSWSFLSSHPATNRPASFSVPMAALPWHDPAPPHVHDETCGATTNVVLSPLDGATVYANVVYGCGAFDPVRPPGFFRLGTRLDTDGDGLADAFELLVEGTDPELADTDGDGAPDGADPEVWALAHPMWATNVLDANIGITWHHLGESFPWAVLQIGNLSRSLENETQPLFLRLPPGMIVSFSISSGDGEVYPSYWLAGRHVACGPYLYDPPMWFRTALGEFPDSRTPIDIAVPVLSVSPVLDGQPGDRHIATNGSVCVHGGSPVQRFSWSVAPDAISGKWSPFAGGAVQIDETGPYIDVSAAPGDRTGPFGFLPVDGLADGTALWGFLTNSLSAHLCDANPTNPFCSVCGCPDSPTNALISISQDYRYALFGTTNMSRFVATVQGGETNDIVWTVSPDLPDGVWLHASDDSEFAGEGEIAGVAQVWADSGLSTNQFAITASIPFAPDKSVSTTFTTVAIDAEPICTETDASGFVVNPCMVPTGETATFRIKVFPSSVPDAHIRWNLSGGHAQFAGSRYGREVRVLGTSEGPVHLEVVLDGYNGVNPTFDAYVADMVAVPVDAWIVVGAEGAVVNNTDLTRIIGEANPILRQVCISCYVHQVFYTNRFDWVDLSQCSESEYDDILDEMCAVGNNSSGMEIHFVQRLLTGRLGENDSHGMVLPSTVNGRTFAHETGHAMGLHDIYAFSNDPPLVVSNICDPNLCPDDWSGNDPRGFYKPPNIHFNLIRRLIMCGDGNPISRDFPAGEVYGILNLNGEKSSFGWADVGACSGSARRLPNHD